MDGYKQSLTKLVDLATIEGGSRALQGVVDDLEQLDDDGKITVSVMKERLSTHLKSWRQQ
jgi:hypothetical protein